MNFDGFLSGSTPASQPDPQVKANENDWFASLTGGVGIGAAPEKSSSDSLDAAQKPPEVDWFSSLTGVSTNAADKSVSDEASTKKPNAEENDWLGSFAEGIGLGGPKGQDKTDIEKDDEPADDWLANLAGGLGFGNPKEDSVDEAKVSDNQDHGEESKSSSTEVESALSSGPSNETSKPAVPKEEENRQTPLVDKDDADFVDIALTDHGADTAAISDSGKSSARPEGLHSPTTSFRMGHEPEAESESTDAGLDDNTESIGNKPAVAAPGLESKDHSDYIAHREPGENDTESEATEDKPTDETIDNKTLNENSRPQLSGRGMVKNSFSSSVRNLMGLADDDSESNKSDVSESQKEDSKSTSSGNDSESSTEKEQVNELKKAPARPQLSRGLEKSSFTTSIRNLMGFSDEDQESSSSSSKSRSESIQETNAVEEKEAESQEGLMDFFGNLLGKQESKQDLDSGSPTSDAAVSSGGDAEFKTQESSDDNVDEQKAMSLEESSESADSQTHQDDEAFIKSDSLEEVNNTIQAHVSNATESVNSLLSSVQGFVSNKVDELTDYFIVIPRNPKAHRRRAKPWWPFKFS